MQSKAKTVAEYLASLPASRRKEIKAVHKVIKKHLPKGYREGMQYGMICYAVPLKLYPPGYHCAANTPLPYAGLAAQKNANSLYLCVFMDKLTDAWFRKAFKASGKRLDMGKCCVRFKKADDLPLEVIGKAIARYSVPDFIKLYEKSLPPAKVA
jgi:hypothetical protein